MVLLDFGRKCLAGLSAGKRIVKYYSTIYAVSSGSLKSGVAVIRVSGKQSSLVIRRMTKCEELPPARLAILKTIHDPEDGQPLDKGIVLWFPGPRSFTGEDVCELHVHGSKAVIRAILLALSKLKNFRPAKPGEFTKRAFYASKFDLTEVEGLSDLIDAETEMQRRQALYQMEGSLKQIYLDWRSIILQNLAHVEAFIDFSEDENIEGHILSVVQSDLVELSRRIQEHLNDFRKGEILREGIKTAIIGSPNVGKSSLLNLLCERPAAIVTEIAGTTRDVVQNTINVNGFPVVISDTAGIRTKCVENVVEQEGIRRSMKEAATADLMLLVMDARDVFRDIEDYDCCNSALYDKLARYRDAYGKRLGIEESVRRIRCIAIVNKVDLLLESRIRLTRETTSKHRLEPEFVFISCKTEEGIADLLKSMCLHFDQLCAVPNKTNPSCTRERHRHHLQQTLFHTNAFLTLSKAGAEQNILFAAEELRSAAQNLGIVTGAVVSEEVLDAIFKTFCIGK